MDTHTDPQPEFSGVGGYDPEAPDRPTASAAKFWPSRFQSKSYRRRRWASLSAAGRELIDLTRLGSLSTGGGGERRRFRGLLYAL